MSSKRILCSVAILTTLAGAFALSHSNNAVQSIDPKFNIRTLRIVRNAIYTNYVCSDFEARVRHMLRRIGLPVKAPQRLGVSGAPWMTTLFIRYEGGYAS